MNKILGTQFAATMLGIFGENWQNDFSQKSKISLRTIKNWRKDGIDSEKFAQILNELGFKYQEKIINYPSNYIMGQGCVLFGYDGDDLPIFDEYLVGLSYPRFIARIGAEEISELSGLQINLGWDNLVLWDIKWLDNPPAKFDKFIKDIYKFLDEHYLVTAHLAK